MTVARFELEVAQMVISHRWAALATLGADGPTASMVAYATTRDAGRLILFLSGLSEHTSNLTDEPRVSLVISDTDQGSGDPQTLARVTLKGLAQVIPRTSPEFEEAWRVYLSRLPDAAPRIVLGDFSLFQVILDKAHYVGGFAQAHTIDASRLSAAALEFDTTQP